jgi:hypothetical protein
LVDSQTGVLTPQTDNSFNGLSGAPQIMIGEPTNQFLFVAQEDGTLQVVDVAEGAVVGLQSNDSEGGLGQVTLNGEGKALALATVGSNEILVVGEAAATNNLQSYIVSPAGTLSGTPISTLTVGGGTSGVAGLAAYTASGQTFVVAVGDTSTANAAPVQSFHLGSDGTLTSGASQTVATGVGLHSVVVEPTSTSGTPQTALILGTGNAVANLFALPIDSTGALQASQVSGSIVPGHPTSLFTGLSDLFFATSDAGLTPVLVNTATGQVTLGTTSATDTGGSLCGVLLQTQAANQ